MRSSLILCDAAPFTGNMTTASRLCALLVGLGLACEIADVRSPPLALPAGCVLVMAIHACKGGAAALALLDAASDAPPPALIILLSGTDVNEQACELATLRACARASAVVAVSPDLSARYNALCLSGAGHGAPRGE